MYWGLLRGVLPPELFLLRVSPGRVLEPRGQELELRELLLVQPGRELPGRARELEPRERELERVLLLFQREQVLEPQVLGRVLGLLALLGRV